MTGLLEYLTTTEVGNSYVIRLHYKGFRDHIEVAKDDPELQSKMDALVRRAADYIRRAEEATQREVAYKNWYNSQNGRSFLEKGWLLSPCFWTNLLIMKVGRLQTTVVLSEFLLS